MIRENSSFVRTLENVCCDKTKMQSPNYSVLDLESSLNSNKTFTFICHVVVLSFSSKLYLVQKETQCFYLPFWGLKLFISKIVLIQWFRLPIKTLIALFRHNLDTVLLIFNIKISYNELSNQIPI